MNPHESSGMKISLVGSLFFALLGLTFAFITGSQAVLLDGAFNLVAVATVLFAMRIQKLLTLPDSRQMPAGYVALEPFYLLVKGLIILLITCYVVATNVIVMVNGGNAIELGIILIYIIIAITGNIVTWLLISSKFKKANTPMLALERQNWMINTLISCGIGCAFVMVYLFRNGFLEPFVPYVDQVIVIAVGLFTIYVPFAAIRTGGRELLLAGPDKELQESAEKIVNKTINKTDLRSNRLYIIKTGRKYWFTLIIDPVKEMLPASFSDQIKSSIAPELTKHFDPYHLDVIISKNIPE
jgi:predicted Co/Zn/Cd cation transporter (cation efflux family)